MFSFLLSNAFPKIGLYTALGILFYHFQLMGTLAGVLIVHILNTMIFMIWIPVSSFQTIHQQQEEARYERLKNLLLQSKADDKLTEETLELFNMGLKGN